MILQLNSVSEGLRPLSYKEITVQQRGPSLLTKPGSDRHGFRAPALQTAHMPDHTEQGKNCSVPS